VRYQEGSVIAYHGVTLDLAVDLTPFCVWRCCPACSSDELFYLHQRKKKKDRYFSFTTGHQCITASEKSGPAQAPPAALGIPPLGSGKAAAAAGWRATWTDLAGRSRRLTARAVDLALMSCAAAAGGLAAHLAGMSLPGAVVAVAIPFAVLYEPLAALTGGTPGKRLLRIEPISVWDSRSLRRSDVIRRAMAFDVQFLFPPLIVRNIAWLLWDPARQCLHDRAAGSIVIAGRSRPGRKI
jgi:hypothetical protein